MGQFELGDEPSRESCKLCLALMLEYWREFRLCFTVPDKKLFQIKKDKS